MVISLLLIMTLQTICLAHDLPNCKNSTVEQAWGAEYASQARSFLVTLQKVVESDDSAKFARLVHYPVRINGTHVVKITKRSELTRVSVNHDLRCAAGNPDTESGMPVR
jgi:hypothetical protein